MNSGLVIWDAEECFGYVYNIVEEVRTLTAGNFEEVDQMLLDELKNFDEDDFVHCTWSQMGAWFVCRMEEV